jgi:hypothetical protein
MRLAFRAEPPALIILEMRNAARLAARILHAMSDSPPSDPGEEQDARLIHVDNAQGMQVGDYGIQDNRSTSVTAGRDALIAGRDINVENLHVHSGESSPKNERRPDSGWSVPPFMAPALPLAFVERPAVASRLDD